MIVPPIDKPELSPEARELDCYIDNAEDLWNQEMACFAALARKVRRGTFEPNQAPWMFRSLVDRAARNYVIENRESVGSARHIFPRADRNALCHYLAGYFTEMVNGNPEVWGDLGEDAAETLRSI